MRPGDRRWLVLFICLLTAGVLNAVFIPSEESKEETRKNYEKWRAKHPESMADSALRTKR